jgi:hypothetical protein
VGRLADWQYRRQLKRRYRMRLDPVAFMLGLQMRNHVAARLRPGEGIVEDELVVVAESSGPRGGAGTRALGWIVLTTHRVYWGVVPSHAITEVPLAELRLTFREEDWDTYAWKHGRRSKAISLGFMTGSVVREQFGSSAEQSEVVEGD